jgi:glycosyltransferase involved in cell wall biosynthesis
VNIAFVNENTMGHASYLLPYIRMLQEHKEWGIEPILIDATPLPEDYAQQARFPLKGLRRPGLDLHESRWRLGVSKYVLDQVRELQRRTSLQALVLNPQSTGLRLEELTSSIPILVCLDATFHQLSQNGWFAPDRLTRWFQLVTLAPLRGREKRLFRLARRLFPWSKAARKSLMEHYGVAPEKIEVLPPSVELPAQPREWSRPAAARPQILFVGSDFSREGGPVLRECFRQHLATRCELHVITNSRVLPEPGVFVHLGVKAGSQAWRERWEQADLLVFASRLATFAIPLLEALAFEVPIISVSTGEALDILENGMAGLILPQIDILSLKAAIERVLDDPAGARARAAVGRKRIEETYLLGRNAQRLAATLKRLLAEGNHSPYP